MFKLINIIFVVLSLLGASCTDERRPGTKESNAWYDEASPVDPDGNALTVATYNIFNIYTINDLEDFPVAESTRAERMTFLVKELVEMGDNRPDILFLQEAFHNEERDKIVEGVKNFYSAVNHDSQNIVSKNKFGSGLLIFYAKDKMTLVPDSVLFEEFNFSVSEGGEIQYATKGFLNARFKFRGALLDVFNTHLSSIDSDGDKRLEQVKYIKQRMAISRQINNPDLQIFGGDLNTNKYQENHDISKPIDALRNGTIENFSLVDAVDNFELDDIATWDKRNILVEVAKWPLSHQEQIDHIYIHSEGGKCQPDLDESDRIFTNLYPMVSAGPVVKARIAARAKAMKVLEDASLDQASIERYRVYGDSVSRASVWKWDTNYENENNWPSEDVRKAIDTLLVLTPVSDVNLSALDSLKYNFPTTDDEKLYLLPLSDHYGIKSRIVCGSSKGSPDE